MELIRVVCLSVLLWSSVTTDDDVVPDFARPVRFDFAQSCIVGDHTFVLEKTTLADVVQAMGEGIIHFNGGDASKGEFFVDYTENGYLIRFSSNSEMGGDDHKLGEVEVRPLTASEHAYGLPILQRPVTFEFGSVGMSFSNLVAALGPAVKSHGVEWYEYTGKVPIKGSSNKVLNYDVLGTLKVRIARGKVTAIDIGHITSS